MNSSYQPPFPDHDVNVILPVPQARALFNSLLAAAAQPCPNTGELTNRNLEPGVEFRSATEICSSSSGSSSPSPSQLLPALQLSTSTLCGSDFPTTTNRRRASRQLQGEGDAAYVTPAPRTHSCSETWTAGPTGSHEAFNKHMEESMPKVQQACKRLHQVLGLRNEDVYELPQMPLPPRPESVIVGSVVEFNPALKHLRGVNAGVGIQIGPSGVTPGLLRGKTNLQTRSEEQRQHIGVQGEVPKPQPGLVEKPLTLRERLLLYGKQPYGNQVKTELRSLTIHDLTPDMRTGGFKNEMLAHFEADVEGRTRLVSYEVNVPVPNRQLPAYSSNGAALPLTERWHFLLISMPLVTFKPGTTSNTKHTPALPPNLPTSDNNKHPPSSWLIFGAPVRAIRLHPASKDHIIVRTPDGSESFRPVKRYDYDYSFNGIPDFEFMDKSSVLGPALGSQLDRTIGGPFLCGRDVAAYQLGNDFITRPQIDSGGTENKKAALRDEDARRWDDVENLEREMANSWWWNQCRGKFYEDRNTWVRIKDSMARSCCRIVLRVQNDADHHQRLQLQREQQQRSMVSALSATGVRKPGLDMSLDADKTTTVGSNGLDSEAIEDTKM